MDLDHDAAYQVLQTHDARWDGRLFVGVTSTGVYCRPVCRVRLPLQKNCRFFATRAQAEAAAFRPCLKCRPEIAPGLSHTDSSQALAAAAARWIDHAVQSGERLQLPAIAARLGVTDRHLRRIFQAAHGVAPRDYVATQRLLLAKQLLTDTAQPVTQVALASGFDSLRRFNAAFAERYRLNPTQLRRERGARPAMRERMAALPTATPHVEQAVTGCGHAEANGVARLQAVPGAAAAASALAHKPRAATHTARVGLADACHDGCHGAGAGAWHDTGALRLAWRPPYDVDAVLGFYGRRALHGVEALDGLTLRRTLGWQHRGQPVGGWLAMRFVPERREVHVSTSDSLAPVLAAVLQRVRQALDLNADPACIDPVMALLPVPMRPGARLASGFDGFEIAVRVILGQQVSVQAARTLAQRLLVRFGTPIQTPFAALTHLFPDAVDIAAADPEAIGRLGIVRQRVRALQALAAEIAAGRIALHPAADVRQTLAALHAIPGIGDWTAQLIAMRALAYADAWPAADIGLLNALGSRDVRHITTLADAWRPWRGYAVMRLWQHLEEAVSPATAVHSVATTIAGTLPTTETTTP